MGRPSPCTCICSIQEAFSLLLISPESHTQLLIETLLVLADEVTPVDRWNSWPCSVYEELRQKLEHPKPLHIHTCMHVDEHNVWRDPLKFKYIHLRKRLSSMKIIPALLL